MCNDGPEIVSLNDGYPNINGAALLERALSGTNFGNGNNNMANLNNGLSQGGQNGGGVNANCLINLPNHSLGLSGGNHQINFANATHFTGGGGVDTGGGNECNQGIGK